VPVVIGVLALGTVGAAALPVLHHHEESASYDRDHAQGVGDRADGGSSGNEDTDSSSDRQGSVAQAVAFGTVPATGGLPPGMVPLGRPARYTVGGHEFRRSFTLPGDPAYVPVPSGVDPAPSDTADPSAPADATSSPAEPSPTAPDSSTPTPPDSATPTEPTPVESTTAPVPVPTDPSPGPGAPTVTPTPTPTVSAPPTPTSAPSAPTATPADPAALPVGDLPGWRQVFADDFSADAPLGSFLSTYGSAWSAYPSTWSDTSGNGRYDQARTLSVSASVLDIYLHSENGVHYVAAPTPKLPAMTYGRYSVRFQADSVAGYKTAWLLWPDDNQWPAHGEIDFPEGDLDSTISAFSHWALPSGGQDAFPTNATYAAWHTSTVEWTPGKLVFYLDGEVIGTSVRNVPSTPMHWVLQTETQLSGGAPAASASGHVRIDWATAYTYAP
jgi:hypothetical protein